MTLRSPHEAALHGTQGVIENEVPGTGNDKTFPVIFISSLMGHRKEENY
jgi:hypothetical protein